MADKTLSQVVGGGGGAGFKLAPDLTRDLTAVLTQVVTIDPSGGSYITALSFTGKYMFSYLTLRFLPTTENCGVRLTIDGQVILLKDNFTPASSDISLFGDVTGGSTTNDSAWDGKFQCDQSFLLEVYTQTDNSVQVTYLARPIQ